MFLSGKEFHRQLENPFYLETETEASKASEIKAIATLPRTVQGKTKTQVKLPSKVIHLKNDFTLLDYCTELAGW